MLTKEALATARYRGMWGIKIILEPEWYKEGGVEQHRTHQQLDTGGFGNLLGVATEHGCVMSLEQGKPIGDGVVPASVKSR
ncbi:MAG: hypothetical protein AB7S66_02290 [Sphaerochaeta sp.]|jgi:hypothetical protein|uniref:hypothetical protein n=1 Tax=Sphaerochaeta sp. TaxID=1972642 RepID=UPI003D0DC8D6